jgi:hypothetical protein
MTYTSGLRLRVPEPLPECEDGETPQQYFARILAQTAIESATSAENTTGDSSPTPFNLGQVQLDVSNLQTDVDELQTDMTSAQTTIAQHTAEITVLQTQEASIASGLEDIVLSATQQTVYYPASGTWDVVLISGALDVLGDLHVLENYSDRFVAKWTGGAAAGATMYWIAHKRA